MTGRNVTQSDTRERDTESDTRERDTESNTREGDTESDTREDDTESDTREGDTESEGRHEGRRRTYVTSECMTVQCRARNPTHRAWRSPTPPHTLPEGG